MRPMVYLAQPMGGRLWNEVWAEAQEARFALNRAGLDGWSPSLKEAGINNPFSVIDTPKPQLRKYWAKDFSALQACNALLSLRGDLISEGVGLEIGIAGHAYNMPVVIISPDTKIGRVTHIVADFVAPSLESAVRWLKRAL